MLRYLFTTQFNDGTILEQTQEDVSKTHFKKSAFFDVLNNTSEVKRFWLSELERFQVDQSKPLRKYLVDLTDGHFEFNGDPFFMHEQTMDPSKNLSKFRLVYFRRVQQSRNVESGKESTKTIYIIGWQANYPTGKNHKQIIYIE